ncbi:MAG: DNA/RNA non-specific endonuclease [Alistipes sp.]|nr:DNA/RNA non-specific endonuclease [Alistipes sp.]
MRRRTPHKKISRSTQGWIIVLLLLLLGGVLYFSYRRPITPVVPPAATSSSPHETASARRSAEAQGKARSVATPKASRRDAVQPPADFSEGEETLALPALTQPAFILRNAAGRYTLCYDTLYRQAAWVAYRLTPEEVRHKGVKRSNRFYSDTMVRQHRWPSAVDRDYRGSGYDRGHLLPSADRNDSPSENLATFSLANIAPQRPALNRGVWRLLEEQVRRWAAAGDTLYIVAGGVLRPDLPRIGEGVGVPNHFFKAILLHHDTLWRAVAFLIPNQEELPNDFSRYKMSVDSLEKLLSQDFFPALPDTLESRIEAQCPSK